jgi:hypothetical protein
MRPEKYDQGKQMSEYLTTSRYFSCLAAKVRGLPVEEAEEPDESLQP